MKKNLLITAIIIVAIILLIIYVNTKKSPTTSEEIAKCIGENSVLYIQLGCPACQKQEELFGENSQFLTKVDCLYERDKCEGIEKTPTWIIDGEKYIGVQSIEKLQSLTGC